MIRKIGTKGFEKGDHGEKKNAGVRTQNKSPLSDYFFSNLPGQIILFSQNSPSNYLFLLLLKTALFGLKQVLSNFYAIGFL
jgi:hypothetical protein